MGKLREHYMVVLMPLPLLLFALLPEEKLHRWRSTAFCGVLAALALVALLALAAQAMVEAVDFSKCRMIMPWRGYADRLCHAGVEPGTIATSELRYHHPVPTSPRIPPGTTLSSAHRTHFFSPTLTTPDTP